MSTDVWFVNDEEELAAEISALASFQAFLGVSGEADPAAAAAARVHTDRVPVNEEREIIALPELIAKRPFLLIWSDEPRIHRVATGNALDFQNVLAMLFEISQSQITAADATANRPHSMMRWMKIKVGTVIRDLFDAWPVCRETVQISFRMSQRHTGQDVPYVQGLVTFRVGLDE